MTPPARRTTRWQSCCRSVIPAGFDFSFSGLKTAVLRHVRQRQGELGGAQLPQHEINDLAASFQRRVVETLIDKTFAAARWHGARSIGIAGGVSANSRLRQDALAKSERSEIPVYIPRLSLSTDNAAMIAAAGLRQLAAGRIAPPDLNAAAALPL
jgi:N6-L-threonylcarbamoyladenine synthase